MARTLKLKINEKELARMLNVKEADIWKAEKAGRLFNGVPLPKKVREDTG